MRKRYSRSYTVLSFLTMFSYWELPFGCCFFGACGRIRTGDLLITSELLCQLSHTSINADGSIAHFAGAVNRFSGEESLFLLRLLPKWVRTGNDNT